MIEIVSPEDRQRDTKTKRREYAQAGIPEYWIIAPEYKTVTVLILSEPPVSESYSVHVEFKTGEQASSHLLTGFILHIDELFASASCDLSGKCIPLLSMDGFTQIDKQQLVS